MTKKIHDVSRLCQEFGLMQAELPQQLCGFIKFKTIQQYSTIYPSELCGDKTALIAEGLVYVFKPKENGKEKKLIKVLGKHTSLCEILPNLPEGTVFKVKETMRIFFLRKADESRIEEIPGMRKLRDGLDQHIHRFKDAWAGLIQRPTKTSLESLFQLFPGHKFQITDLANLYGISRKKFYKDTADFRDELFAKYQISPKKNL